MTMDDFINCIVLFIEDFKNLFEISRKKPKADSSGQPVSVCNANVCFIFVSHTLSLSLSHTHTHETFLSHRVINSKL